LLLLLLLLVRAPREAALPARLSNDAVLLLFVIGELTDEGAVVATRAPPEWRELLLLVWGLLTLEGVANDGIEEECAAEGELARATLSFACSGKRVGDEDGLRGVEDATAAVCLPTTSARALALLGVEGFVRLTPRLAK
jgi:hypothetical protein